MLSDTCVDLVCKTQRSLKELWVFQCRNVLFETWVKSMEAGTRSVASTLRSLHIGPHAAKGIVSMDGLEEHVLVAEWNHWLQRTCPLFKSKVKTKVVQSANYYTFVK